jgi:hypothetical protein
MRAVVYQFVLLYTVGWQRIANAAGIGDQAGLPIHRFDGRSASTRSPRAGVAIAGS